MIYLDTETCGFHGPIVLMQYAEDMGPTTLHSVWTEPIQETLEIIESFCIHEDGICGFNLSFDWFHICQLYNTLFLLGQKIGNDKYPEDHISDYVDLEPIARDGFCLKPVRALDLMLDARKGEYQSTLDRKDITIRRVPMAIGEMLCHELGSRVKIKDIYFSRLKDKSRRWRVKYRELEDGTEDTNFVDVVLNFAPSSALKALAMDALDIKEDAILRFVDVDIPDRMKPTEIGYAPYAKAVYTEYGKNANAWPDVIKYHISHWGFNRMARVYAEKDVVYLQNLHQFFTARRNDVDVDTSRRIALGLQYTQEELFKGGDVDSDLACMVGAVRWKGFRIDTAKINNMVKRQEEIINQAEWNMNSPEKVLMYLDEVLDETEKQAMMTPDGKYSSKGIILEGIAKWKISDVCNDCHGLGCKECNNEGLVSTDEPHPAAARAQKILDFRHAGKRLNLLQKFKLAGRFHASFNVIGTLSSRMSGGDGLNAQGIPHEEDFRECFPLAWEGMILDGGDFSGFEVALADAAYGDPDLRADLMTGIKIHALFGQYLFPPKTPEEITATQELPGEKNLYGRSKNGVFALLYGGEGYTLKTRVGVPEDVANEAYHRWCERYKVWGQERKKIFDMFCSMRQPGGIGTKVEWHDPSDYIESMLGFRRYFDLENRIVKALYDLGTELPDHFLKFKRKVVRRDREQTESGALRSALFGAAFGLQAANMRAAANHVIQASGAEITKRLQHKIWSIQPPGISNWRVMPMNIHDEVMTPTLSEYAPVIKGIVDQFVESYKNMVPLLEIKWVHNLESWADK